MTLRLLCIANPAVYAKGTTDVPLGYARLAAHPAVSLFHVDTEVAREATDSVACVPIEPGFDPDAFERLADAPRMEARLSSFDLAFCRTLKPLPTGYLEQLIRLSAVVPFLNDPAAIRRQLDPSFLVEAAVQHLPEHRLARDPEDLRVFLEEHGTIVAKRYNTCGGRGVFRVEAVGHRSWETDNAFEGSCRHTDLEELWRALTRRDPGPLLLMRFLPRVVEGEKRIVVVEGEIQGAYHRRSHDGHWVQNVSRGASCTLAAVTAEDRTVVRETSGAYTRAGIRLLGYDLIPDESGALRVGEINAGNVGGLFRLEALGVAGLTDRFVETLASVARRARTGAGLAPRSPIPSRPRGSVGDPR